MVVGKQFGFCVQGDIQGDEIGGERGWGKGCWRQRGLIGDEQGCWGQRGFIGGEQGWQGGVIGNWHGAAGCEGNGMIGCWQGCWGWGCKG